MIHKALAGVAALMKCISGALVGIIILINLYAVVMRYFFARPLLWCEEVSLLLFVWSVFCSMVPVVHRRACIALDFFVDLMPPGMRRAMAVVVELASAGLLVVTCVYCLELMRRSLYRFTPILQIPYRYVYLATVVGMGLSAVILLVQAVDDMRAVRQREEPEQK